MLKPLVSVCVQTYQHVNYIKQCLDSILMQQTTFPFEIILGEDDSIDGTRDICIDYANRYPDKIKLFLRHRKDVIYINGNPTGRYNFIENLKACNGKYIALLDGDDYWTDPLKLQKQVDFLESNRHYGICFHNVMQLNTFDLSKKILIPNTEFDVDYNIQDYILSNKTASCSIVFNKDYLGILPKWFYKIPFGDLGVILIIMKNSNKKGRILKDVMSVYRVHSEGIHGKYLLNNTTKINTSMQHLDFVKKIEKRLLTEPEYKYSIYLKKVQTLKQLINFYKNKSRIKFLKFKLMLIILKLNIKF